MGWKVWGVNWTSFAMNSHELFQGLIFDKNTVLLGIRTWVIVYNDPVFTSLGMSIYGNKVVDGENALAGLIANSTDVRTKAEVHTLANGVKEIYFTFDQVSLQAGATYNFVITASGYVPTSNSYLAWMKGFPDPVYPGYTPAVETIAQSPYQLYAIGGDL